MVAASCSRYILLWRLGSGKDEFAYVLCITRCAVLLVGVSLWLVISVTLYACIDVEQIYLNE